MEIYNIGDYKNLREKVREKITRGNNIGLIFLEPVILEDRTGTFDYNNSRKDSDEIYIKFKEMRFS